MKTSQWKILPPGKNDRRRQNTCIRTSPSTGQTPPTRSSLIHCDESSTDSPSTEIAATAESTRNEVSPTRRRARILLVEGKGESLATQTLSDTSTGLLYDRSAAWVLSFHTSELLFPIVSKTLAGLEVTYNRKKLLSAQVSQNYAAVRIMKDKPDAALSEPSSFSTVVTDQNEFPICISPKPPLAKKRASKVKYLGLDFLWLLHRQQHNSDEGLKEKFSLEELCENEQESETQPHEVDLQSAFGKQHEDRAPIEEVRRWCRGSVKPIPRSSYGTKWYLPPSTWSATGNSNQRTLVKSPVIISPTPPAKRSAKLDASLQMMLEILDDLDSLSIGGDQTVSSSRNALLQSSQSQQARTLVHGVNLEL